ncbi:RNA polymerase sigma-70 factor [Siphonobacter sp. SORGH_AS_0500]|uniref:RNA polymerase sigma-70 factor n=1 Tax=Siphonobacter sp. SORGH_AS_0500 TaxID=1864824 RepID=UPI0028553A3D|nr:RNA polymerase sigma-70 factor [Siphonobacter sp. SORGH_AS_0500]MDR6194498.1 RNA polymerase sigma-70 factor (family 1) [Siphonobacter sp. SORGH_AS_0500]
MAALNRWSDAELSQALQENNRAAFSEIYERYWKPLYRAAYQKTRSKETAEELVQDLFVSLWQRRETVQIQELKRYLFTALKFSIIRLIESEQVHEKFVNYYQSFLATEDRDTEELLDFQDLSEAIERNLRELPEKSQEVFRLSRFEQLSIPEIAQRLQVSEKAVEYHLTRVLKHLRTHLHEIALGLMLGLWR